MELSTWYVLLMSAPLVWGQFPAVCNTPDNLNAKECCPNNCGHGFCRNISDSVVSSWNNADTSVVEKLLEGAMGRNWPIDVRYQWPLLVFQRVCSCNPGWGGYNCSRCDFGYVSNGQTCVKQTNGNQLLVRQNFADLDDTKRREYIKVIKAAKNEMEMEMEMEWAVVVREPERMDTDGSFELQNVSTYDMFVTLHTLAGREQDIEPGCKNFLNGVTIDFAHQSSAFLTWHRYYLLIVESELRRIAKKMGIMDFTLPYWDWQMDNTIFHDDFFGTPLYDTSRTDVSGTLFDDWPTVCDQHYREHKMEGCDVVRRLCNVTNDRTQNRRLQRGHRLNDKPFLPDEASIVMALAANNNNEQLGFRNRLEGFVDLCPGNTEQCLKYIDDSITNNNLHNAVHIFLGGHMRIVPSASNDPIFFLHHANIDRLFESWIRRFGNRLPNYGMQTGGHPGHNLNDYLVPFFPLKTNADMYKRSSELGFSYDSLHQTDNLPRDDSLIQCPINNGEIDPPCERGGYHPDSSNSIYHIQLYLVFFGVVSAAILM